VLVAMVGGATALALNATAPVKLVSVSPELKPVLEGLCSDFRAEPCRPELVQLKAPPEDLMTIVIADQGEKSAELEQFFTQVFSVPAAQRHDSFTTNMSNALGKPWVCPEFETMWAMQPVTWCGAP
jgi:hypothetical protein